ncbi:MAG: polysaccharide deacetylase family protein, partial [Planctomycetes bacterium]|nr:polysaccharide deacetylase family protein [Planctomycetota bacterium]
MTGIRNSLIYKPLGFSLGLFHERLLRNSLTVFVFHEVTDNPSEFCRLYNLNVPPQVFEYQIEFIKKNFNIIGPDELTKLKIPSNAALITFDDGFQGVFKNAIPVLSKHKVPIIIFLNMEPVEGKVFWAGLITYLCNKKPEFVRFLNEKSLLSRSSGPLYLGCSREIVEAYLESSNDHIENEVRKFVGDFCSAEDLEQAAEKQHIFFGNHLFNHYVPLLMSDEDLVNSYVHNRDAMRQYSNYRDFFSFPFGQPNTCFTEAQVQLLLNVGAQRVFSSYPIVNLDVNSPYLDRVPMTS